MLIENGSVNATVADTRGEEIDPAGNARKPDDPEQIDDAVGILRTDARGALDQLAFHLSRLATRLQDRPEERSHVTEAETARAKLLQVFEDLRGYTGLPALKREAVDVRAVWKRAWADVTPSLEGRIAEFVEVLAVAEPRCVGDELRLRQVFRHLFEHALNVAPDPLRVEVRCREVIYRGRTALRIAISDNGPSLSPEDRQNAFDPIHPFSPSRTGRSLALDRDFLQAQGGDAILGHRLDGELFVLLLPVEALPAS